MGKQNQQQQDQRTAIVLLTVLSYLCLLAIPFLLFWRLPQYSQAALSHTVTENVTIKDVYSYKGRGLFLETEDGREFSLGGRNFEIKQKTGWDFLELEPTLSGKAIELEYLEEAQFVVSLQAGNTKYDLTELARSACAEQRFGIYAGCFLAVALSVGSTCACRREFRRPGKKKKTK